VYLSTQSAAFYQIRLDLLVESVTSDEKFRLDRAVWIDTGRTLA
jgi:hypothetical protein